MKIACLADLHVGATTHGIRDPETGLNSRLLDIRRSLQFAIREAIEAGVEHIHIAGDGFDTPNPTATHKRVLLDGITLALEEKIPVSFITGNHDHPVTEGLNHALDFLKAIPGIDVFDTHGVFELDTVSGAPLSVMALPYPIDHVVGGPAHEVYGELVRSASADFLSGHFTLQGSLPAGSEAASSLSSEPRISPRLLGQADVQYVAMGHIHKYQDLSKEGEPPIVYSSSLERKSMDEAKDPKGFVIVDLKHPDEYAFVQTPARQFKQIDIDLRDEEKPTAALIEAAGDVEDKIVKIRYRIETDQVLNIKEVAAALSAAHTITEFESIRDPGERQSRSGLSRDTGLPEAIKAFANEHDFDKIEDDLIEEALDIQQSLR